MGFELENRYLVIKRKDASYCLTESEYIDLCVLAGKVNNYRMGHLGKDSLKCMVVEEDWPEYQVVLNLIESRMNHERSELDKLKDEITALRGELKEITNHNKNLNRHKNSGDKTIAELREKLRQEREKSLFVQSDLNWQEVYSDEGMKLIAEDKEVMCLLQVNHAISGTTPDSMVGNGYAMRAGWSSGGGLFYDRLGRSFSGVTHVAALPNLPEGLTQ